MKPPAASDNPLLDRLPRTTLVVGKGGVGKTTCGAAMAVAFADRGARTLLVSTDPAAALGSVLDTDVGAEARPVTGLPLLAARQLSTEALRAQFLARWGPVIADILDRGTYLDREDIGGIVESALPGADEIFALLALGELVDNPVYDRIVVDTAPTGHTLRLLQLPETFTALLALLDAMQEKHRFMVRALTHRYRADRADEFLADTRKRIERIGRMLTDPAHAAAVLVTRADAVVVSESERYLDALDRMHVHVAAVIVNAEDVRRAAGLALARKWGGRTFTIARADPSPRGVDALRDLMGKLGRLGDFAAPTPAPASGAAAGASPAARTSSSLDVPSLALPLTIVGGKGGVGKTTAACALAIAAAAPERPVLLVSTDPAPSIADALGMREASAARMDEEFPVPGAPGLTALQVDATAAFARVRERYTRQVDAVFETLLARGLDAAADRAIVRDLLALAPPGIDEVYALAVLGDALAEHRFERIIVDPAPTGHLLRLLDMPALAIDWSHRLLRLMLKYKSVTGLGDSASDILAFAQRTRALQALLSDPARAGMLIVALDEPMVRDETARLIDATRARGIALGGVLWNQTRPSSGAMQPPPLPSRPPARQFCAPAMTPPPIGVSALRAWSTMWRAF